MNTMLRSLVMVGCVLGAGAAMAQAPHAAMNHGAGEMKRGAAASMADGTIRKIDKAAGKVTIKHGPIANLNMPPMSMVFKVKDVAMLDKVKVGDQVVFAAENIDGALTVTTLKPAK